MDEDDAGRVFYLSLLRHVGCTAESDMAASYLGDEIAFRSGAMTLDFTRPSVALPYVVRRVGAGKPAFGRARHVGRISPKTADAHIQHIYAKPGVSTRAGATLLAVEHGLVDRAEDRETSR